MAWTHTANQRPFHLNPVPPPRLTPLHAGPVSLYWGDGDLRYIRLGDREVLRRIYVAVRDQFWGTVPYTIHDLDVDDGGDRFTIEFRARHRQEGIAFDWQGLIYGRPDGQIRFHMDGVARSTFQRNRIGFCILHPASCAGMACIAEDADGQRVEGRFPERISPHQPYLNLRALTLRLESGASVETRFQGDIFEMEDQRNWTDASFKIYSTPLDRPMPVTVHEGDHVVQAVDVVPHNLPAASVPWEPETVVRTDEHKARPVNVTLTGRPVRRFPALGLGAAPGQALNAKVQEKLARLHLDHIRVDLFLDRPDLPELLAQAIAQARALHTKLEVALFSSRDPMEEFARLGAALENRHARGVPDPNIPAHVARWLVFSTSAETTPAPVSHAARLALKPLAPKVPIGGGTNLYFTELNRFPPALDDLDFVVYTCNPQVHAFDSLSLVETLTAQSITVASAQALAGDKPVVISPITLRPRFNPHQTLAAETRADDDTAGDGLPASADIRQASLFAAAWTLGSLATLAPSPVDTLTYYGLTGLHGVMASSQGSPHPDQFPVDAYELYPVYHLFDALGPFSAGQVLATQVDEPLCVTALTVQHDGRRRILLANLTDERLTVNVHGAQPTEHRAGHSRAVGRLRMLDESTLDTARQNAGFFAADPGASTGDTVHLHETLTLDLAPYAVAALDAPLHPGM